MEGYKDRLKGCASTIRGSVSPSARAQNTAAGGICQRGTGRLTVSPSHPLRGCWWLTATRREGNSLKSRRGCTEMGRVRKAFQERGEIRACPSGQPAFLNRPNQAKLHSPPNANTSSEPRYDTTRTAGVVAGNADAALALRKVRCGEGEVWAGIKGARGAGDDGLDSTRLTWAVQCSGSVQRSGFAGRDAGTGQGPSPPPCHPSLNLSRRRLTVTHQTNSLFAKSHAHEPWSTGPALTSFSAPADTYGNMDNRQWIIDNER